MTSSNPDEKSRPTREMSEDEIKTWSQAEYVKATRLCEAEGIRLAQVVQPKSQILPPLLALWYIKTMDQEQSFWIITGNFSADIAMAHTAKHAREAIRYFSMSWHMKAASLENQINSGNIAQEKIAEQQKQIGEITARAEALYDIHANDQLWSNTGLE